MLKHLIPLLTPRDGESNFIDVFGGSAVVILNKPRHPSEIYNDLDGELVNLFRVIRHPRKYKDLFFELINTPVSREEFREAIKEKKRPVDCVKRAAQFITVRRQIFGGVPGNASDRNWGTARSHCAWGGVTINAQVSRWLNPILKLHLLHARMSGVVVDQQDGVRCIRQWDAPDAVFYCDPPYMGTESYYKNNHCHNELADALRSVKGRVVLSYYDAPEIRALYPGWMIKQIRTHATMCGTHRSKEKTARTELILQNRP